MSSLAIKRAQPAAAVTANVSTAQVFALLSNSLLAASIPVPGKLVLDGRKFTVRAEGNLYTAGNYTAKASLMAGLALPASPLVIGNWTALLGAGTARAVNNIYTPWYIEAELQFDSNGGYLQGAFSQLINNLFDAPAALSNQLTGINGTNSAISQAGTSVAPTDPAFYIGVALTFGTAAATNVGNLVNFELGF